jgi:DNA-binding transcriptional LysR family regulator
MDRFKAIETFIVAARAENFAAAARKLNLSRAMVGRQVSDLEKRLGTRLFNRTTRDVSLTFAGQRYLSVCTQFLSDLASEEAKISDLQKKLSGVLRIASARSFGEIHMARAIADFRELNPDLAITMELAAGTKTPLQLHQNGFDLGICISHPANSVSVPVKISDFEWLLCASPSYLERHPPIKRIEQLSRHNALVNPIQTPNGVWLLNDGAEVLSIKLNVVIAITNYLALRQIIVDGAGVGILPSFCIRDDLLAKRVVQVLPALTCGRGEITAVYPHYEHIPAKVRTFTSFLRKRFGGQF